MRISMEQTVKGGEGKIEFKVTEEEHNALLAMMAGTQWVRMEEGKLVTMSAFIPLPDPVADPEMQPFWSKPQQPPLPLDYDIRPCMEVFSPSLEVQHLCGYNFTPGNYQYQAEKFKEWGFEQMRSRRGPDGRFWEVWRLPYLLAAKGGLAKAMEGHKSDKAKVDAAISYLCRKASFGSLDVCFQRVAMQIE